jgi:hypothetical protein
MKARINTQVSRPQIELVASFLPIFENMKPGGFALIVRLPESTKENFVLGRLEYHPAVGEFMEACNSAGLVQPFDWRLGQRAASLHEGPRTCQVR